MALLWPSAGPASEAGIAYEACSNAYPEPLLFVGAPPAVVAATGGPPRPGTPAHRAVRRIDTLPWTLVITSDGLLSRVGGGSEAAGKRAIRRWQTGVRRRQSAALFNKTTAGLVDDESMMVIRGTAWNEGYHFDVGDDAERHRFKRHLSQQLRERGCDPEVASDLLTAVSEAVGNVAAHAYGGPGLVHIRYRQEGRRHRIEVEDEGQGPAANAKPGSGTAVMKATSAIVEDFPSEKGWVVSITSRESKEP